MAEPGTAWDGDNQPAHMDGYVQTMSDNGGVHTNSGIRTRPSPSSPSRWAGRRGSGRANRDETLRDPQVPRTRPSASSRGARGGRAAALRRRQRRGRRRHRRLGRRRGQRADGTGADPVRAQRGLREHPLRAEVAASDLDPQERAALDALLEGERPGWRPARAPPTDSSTTSPWWRAEPATTCDLASATSTRRCAP